MSTATASRPAMTKPELSRLIVESTAAVVSTVLVLWLWLWFVGHRPTPARVMAFFAPEFDVPYQEADVRGIAPRPAAEPVEPANPVALADEMAHAVGDEGRQAVVVFLSAPKVGDLAGPKPGPILARIAQAARRNVLVVLDLAQVDSDRELGVYGNAPYQGLDTDLAELAVSTPGVNVAVLCSCEPGQKSWSADGLGRSAFAYFVQRGLAGAAWPRGPGGGRVSPSERTPEALLRYVRRQVHAWTAAERKALQTPALLAVGKSRLDFPLPSLDLKAPLAADLPPLPTEPPPPRETTKKDKDAAKEPPPRDARLVLFDALMTEWAEHHKLLAPAPGRQGPPYRSAPASWQVYESALLHTERLLRAGWNDPASRAAAEQALQATVAARLNVVKLVVELAQVADRMPFRPVRDDPAGEVALNAALRFVSGRDLPRLATRLPESPPAPGAAAPAPAPASAPADDVIPPQLLEAKTLGRPSTYLELQFPAWAARFHELYGVTAFKGGQRGLLLRDAVDRRLAAETALAFDRRGLDWIVRLVREGDALRRGVQDELFGIDDASSGAALKGINDRTARYGKHYDDALALIGRYHEARVLLESVAAALPFYGEWKVLGASRTGWGASGSGDEGLPPGLQGVFAAAADLADTLEAGHATDPVKQAKAVAGLRAARDRLDHAFDLLRNDYQIEVNRLVTDRGEPRWWQIDDVLRTPLIAQLDDRKVLLQRVLRQDSPPADVPPASVPTATAGAAPAGVPGGLDPAFRRRALGLARLELELDRLAFSGRNPPDPKGDIKKVEAILSRGDLVRGGPPGDRPVLDRTLEAFAEASAVFAVLRGEAMLQPSAREMKGRVEDFSEERVGARLRADDRDARFRPGATRASASSLAETDGAVRALEAFGLRDALLVQAERLALDYAPDVDRLVVDARGFFPPVQGREVDVPHGLLRVEVGAQPVRIRKESLDAELPIIVRESTEERTRTDDVVPVPQGRVFVGVTATEPPAPAPAPAAAGATAVARKDASLLVAMPDGAGTPATSAFTRRAGGLTEIGGAAPVPIRFLVKQVGKADRDGAIKVLRVAAFYRGRTDADAQHDVNVATLDFGPPMVVAIAQDRDALARRFPRDVAERIEDQFAKYRGRAYIHEKGKLDYVLTFRNQSREPHRVKITTSLEAEGELKPSAPPASDEKTIAPGQEFRIKGKVTFTDLTDREKALIVRLTYPDDPAESPLEERYVFSRLMLDEYMTFTPDPKDDALYILVHRKAEDKVTEPIPLKEMTFRVNEEVPQPTAGFREKQYLDHDDSLLIRQPLLRSDRGKEMTWTVTVEGVEAKGKIRIP